MQNWINFLRGSLRIEVTGAFPERFLNLCAQGGVAFWALELPDPHTLHLRIAQQETKKVQELARRVGCEITVLERSGLPLYATALRHDTVDIKTADLSRSAVVIGSEGKGISDELLAMCAKTLKIPMRERCESLNAAAAATIVLWQMGL